MGFINRGLLTDVYCTGLLSWLGGTFHQKVTEATGFNELVGTSKFFTKCSNLLLLDFLNSKDFVHLKNHSLNLANSYKQNGFAKPRNLPFTIMQNHDLKRTNNCWKFFFFLEVIMNEEKHWNKTQNYAKTIVNVPN